MEEVGFHECLPLSSNHVSTWLCQHQTFFLVNSCSFGYWLNLRCLLLLQTGCQTYCNQHTLKLGFHRCIPVQYLVYVIVHSLICPRHSHPIPPVYAQQKLPQFIDYVHCWVYNGDMMGIIDYFHCCMGNDYKWRVSINHNQWIWTMKMIYMYHQFRRFSSYLNDSGFSPKLPFRWRSWWVSLPCRRSATAIDGAATGACSAKCLRRPAAGAMARANLGKGRGPQPISMGKWWNMMGK